MHEYPDLPTRRLGRRIVTFDSCDSTNSRALAAVRLRSVEDGTVFVTHRQVAGRGSNGRPWDSGAADGLWMSVVLTEPPGATPLPFLPSVALARILERDYGIEVDLKWPNDIMVEGKKLGGILIESLSQRDAQTAYVVGIGVNVNRRRFDGELEEIATSMLRITGTEHRLEDLFEGFVREMDALDAAGEHLGPAFEARSSMIGRRIMARYRGEAVRVDVLGLTPEGFLRVRYEDGREATWISRAEVELGE